MVRIRKPFESGFATPPHDWDQGSKNPYLAGNFAPVRQELTATDLAVDGTIPDYLDGRYLRIGPNPLRAPNPNRYQWFFGDGMVHGLRIRDGHAQWYRNRWIRSAPIARSLGEQERRGPQLGGFDFAANTNVIGHAGRTLALTEGGVRPYELSEDLDTIGPSDFCGTLWGGYTAHPKRDPQTGELHAVAYSPHLGRHVRYTVTGVNGRVRRHVDIALPGTPVMHDFALTEHHIILYDLPVVLDLSSYTRNRIVKSGAALASRYISRFGAPKLLTNSLMRGSTLFATPNFGMPYAWAPDRRQARIGVLPREGVATDVRWFDIEPCFVFHTLNAYDDGDAVVVQAVRHPSVLTDRTDFYRVSEEVSLSQWRINLDSGSVREEQLDDRTQEFPTVDERIVGRSHRYGYAVGYPSGTTSLDNPDSIVKHDLIRQSAQAKYFADQQPGEFVFVPSSHDAAEDEGTLMGFVYDRQSNRSDLLLLDAATLETAAVVHLPARVPHGFHGNWVPAGA